MTISESQFRMVMGHFASGVTVVTTALDENLTGMTVSSFTSLSLEPRLILICIHQEARSHAIIEQAGLFAVNILNEDQEYLSRRFASHESEKFFADEYDLSERGLPLLRGVLATIECQVVQTAPGGDHTIYIGEVLAATAHKGSPLLYYRSGYHQLR